MTDAQSMVTIPAHDAYPATVTVAGIKIRNLGEIKTLATAGLSLRVGDRVMVEQYGDLTYGVVHIPSHAMPFIPPMRMMRSILRKATDAEAAAIERHEQMGREGMAYCRERAGALGLQMKLVEVFCSFRRREMTFVYTAEDRVDFRQLVKDLARRFGGRIEMRHIGLRDEARRLSGVDSCGLVLCCATFLTDLKPISVRQALNQGLQPNDSRLIGVCGLLKCCLMFERQADKGGASAVQPLIQPTRSADRPGQSDSASESALQ